MQLGFKGVLPCTGGGFAAAPRSAKPLVLKPRSRVASLGHAGGLPNSSSNPPSPLQTQPVNPPLAPRHQDAPTPSPTAAQAGEPSSPAAAPQEPPFKWGADMKNLSICVGISLALWFCPPPAGVNIKAWHLLSVFTGTIVGIITTPLPLGAVAVLGLGAAMLTKVLTFGEAFSAFSSEIP